MSGPKDLIKKTANLFSKEENRSQSIKGEVIKSNKKKAIIIVSIVTGVLVIVVSTIIIMISETNKKQREEAESAIINILEQDLIPAYIAYTDGVDLGIESSAELDDPSHLPPAQECIKQNSATPTIERTLEIQEAIFMRDSNGGNGDFFPDISTDQLKAYAQELRDSAFTIKQLASKTDQCTAPIRIEAKEKRARIAQEEADRKAAEEEAAKAAEAAERAQRALTKEKFDNMSNGMTLSQIKSMFAFDSFCELTVETSAGQVYSCEYGSAYASLTFMYGKLSSKAQRGLY